EMCTRDTTHPTVSEFRHPRECLIRYLDHEPDQLGRRQFVGYWLDNNRVRGQVWHSDPTTWTARTERDGGTVRTLEAL
ncbi:hypothetical protein, partial [Mycobacterium sp. NS-7484]|uniref:hypothetical protein n=1 Tax=Mycobacterium sp. NS-7484 TaxID=1834161 RepID=UPI0013011723